jgi:hypothetical protein
VPLFRFDKGNILFVHVPKTGGTSIELHLKQYAPRALFSTKLKDSKRSFPCSAQHFHGALLEELVPKDFVTHSFMVVRHPLARLLSEYRYRLELGTISLSLDEWWVRNRLLYSRNQYHLDNHLRPQHEFEVPGVQVFKYEDGLEKVAREISRAVGVKFPAKLKRHKRSKGKEIEPSARVIRSVESFYAEDFARYGY